MEWNEDQATTFTILIWTLQGSAFASASILYSFVHLVNFRNLQVNMIYFAWHFCMRRWLAFGLETSLRFFLGGRSFQCNTFFAAWDKVAAGDVYIHLFNNHWFSFQHPTIRNILIWYLWTFKKIHHRQGPLAALDSTNDCILGE